MHLHRSKSQTNLFKILHIISVFSAGDDAENCQNTGLNVDLNVSLRHPPEFEPFEPPLPAENGGDTENCDELFDVKRPEVPVEDSEICDVIDRSSEIEFKGDSGEENRRDDGYLGLLIEAAQLIQYRSEIENECTPAIGKCVESAAVAAEIGGGTKRKQESWTADWWTEFDGTLPALKSKRGRNVVLPEKYRDSFVEPVMRWTPSVHRSRSTVGTVTSKRRSKW
ncbi:hypothetical protein Hanom_Chr02g00169051 [Helianthus anomalus]